MAGDRVKLGSEWGRWTVVSYASPGRRSGDTYLRPRVLVRCVCRAERLAFEVDLKRGRTLGCRSARCRARWEASRALLDHLRGRVAEAEAAVVSFLEGGDD